MKKNKTNIITLSFSKEEVANALIFWLSRSREKSTTDSCDLACQMNNNTLDISMSDENLIVKFVTEDDEKEF